MIIGKLRLIDSFRHMTSALAKLVADLSKRGMHKFKITRELFGPELYTEEQFQKIALKQYFPYHFMTDVSKFDYPQVPPREEFYDPMHNSFISEENYQHVLDIWELTGCRNMKDYSNLYLMVRFQFAFFLFVFFILLVV